MCCTAENCPAVAIDLAAPSTSYCSNDITVPSQLTANVMGGAGTGTGTWSGPGIINPVDGTFDPQAANLGVITYSYMEGPCMYNEVIDITIFESPTANFIASSPICEGDVITITFDGTAEASANFNWDFDGADVISGSGVGPYELSWSNGGQKTLALSIEQNGCPSNAFTANVQVDTPLDVPNISCSSTTNSITYDWTAIAGAVEYIVNGMPQAGTSFTATGLNQGETFTIQVVAGGNGACGNSFNDETCVASNCPPVAIDLPAVNNICLDASAAPFNLTANVSGGAGGGTGIWSGPGITNPIMVLSILMILVFRLVTMSLLTNIVKDFVAIIIP